MLRHYIEFLNSPANFLEVDDRSIVSLPNVPEDCDAFRFVDRTEIIIDDELLTGNFKNHSVWYFVGAQELTVEDVIAIFGPDDSCGTWLWFMKANNLNTLLKTRSGRMCYMFDDYCII